MFIIIRSLESKRCTRCKSWLTPGDPPGQVDDLAALLLNDPLGVVQILIQMARLKPGPQSQALQAIKARISRPAVKPNQPRIRRLRLPLRPSLKMTMWYLPSSMERIV